MNKILLKGGRIYDGTGREPYTADLLIQGDRIAKIEPHLSSSESAACFRVDGLAVTPGFVDIHRHCDKEPLLPPGAHSPSYGSVMLRQGITTAITGNCGKLRENKSKEVSVPVMRLSSVMRMWFSRAI